MNDDRKPTQVLELSVDIDAPQEAVWKALTEATGLKNWFPFEASTEGTGVGSTVTFSFSPEMTWSTNVYAWEPGTRVGWRDDGMMGPGTILMCDFHIETEGGKSRVRLVQSGFGDAAWGDFFEGTENGWRAFLYNLRLYLENHRGKMRRVISERFPTTLPRAVAWQTLTSPAAAFLRAPDDALSVGQAIELQLDDHSTVRAVPEVVKEPGVLSLRFPDLDNALLHVELETGAPQFNVGAYFSVWDPVAAERVAAPVQRALDRLKAAMSASS